MVDTPKDNNGDVQKDPVEATPPEKPPKHRRQWRRSKPRHGKNSDTGTRENNTPDNAEDSEDPADPAIKQDEQGDGKHSPGPLFDHSDAEDTTYQPVSKEENSLDDDLLPPRGS